MSDKKEYNHPTYINTPFFVLQDKKLEWLDKYLFSFFHSLSTSGKIINVSNGYLSTLFNVEIRQIQKRLDYLESINYIKRTKIKYKRCIEVIYLPKNHIENEESTDNELGCPTGHGGGVLQDMGGCPTGHPYIKDNNKDHKTHIYITREEKKSELYLKPFPEKQEMVEIPINIDTQPFPEKQETEKQETENQDAYKTKINTKQRSLQNNININTREEKKSDKEIKEIKEINTQAREEILPIEYPETYYPMQTIAEQTNLEILKNQYSLSTWELSSFDDFWNLYPNKKQKNRVKTLWFARGCHLSAKAILDKLKMQTLKDACFLEGYAPSAANYLIEERWNDEIQIRAKNKSKNNNDLIDTKTW